MKTVFSSQIMDGALLYCLVGITLLAKRSTLEYISSVEDLPGSGVKFGCVSGSAAYQFFQVFLSLLLHSDFR